MCDHVMYCDRTLCRLSLVLRIEALDFFGNAKGKFILCVRERVPEYVRNLVLDFFSVM